MISKDLVEKLREWCICKNQQFSRFGVEETWYGCYIYRYDSNNPRIQTLRRFYTDDDVLEFFDELNEGEK